MKPGHLSKDIQYHIQHTLSMSKSYKTPLIKWAVSLEIEKNPLQSSSWVYVADYVWVNILIFIIMVKDFEFCIIE